MKKRVRAYCPKCNWFLVMTLDGLSKPGKWFCHRCNTWAEAKLREEKMVQ